MRARLSRIAQSLRGKPAHVSHELHGRILPVEILEQIFVLACEEDGAAARALSVVCKVGHSVAKYAARFDTVTLRSGTEREVRRCVSLLSDARAAAATRRDWVARPVVRHLCVLVSPVEARRLIYDTIHRPICSSYSDPTPVVQAARASFAIRDGLNDAIQALLLELAPDLETLCVLRIPGDPGDRRLLPNEIDTIRYGRGFGGFPKLRDLLFMGNLHFEPSLDTSRTGGGACDQSAKAPNAPPQALFPALKRIHMATCWGINSVPFGRWTKQAPALESLRMTLSVSKNLKTAEPGCSNLSLPPELARFGSALSQDFAQFGGTPREPADCMVSRFRSLKEAVVVITRSLAPPGNLKDDRNLGLARRMVKRLTRTASAPKTEPEPEPDPRVPSLTTYPWSPPRDDSFDATKQYLEHDWRERVADPTGGGIDLYEFSQAFRRNVSVYRTTVEGHGPRYSRLTAAPALIPLPSQIVTPTHLYP